MSEIGPIYGIELIDKLPLNYKQPDGWTQAMPSQADLLGVRNDQKSHRVAAGYEVLLSHWREQGKELTQLQAELTRLRTELTGAYEEDKRMQRRIDELTL